MHCDFENYNGEGSYYVSEQIEGDAILPPHYSSSFDWAKIDFWNRLTDEQRLIYKDAEFVLA